MFRAHRSAHPQQLLGRAAVAGGAGRRWPRSGRCELLALTDHDTVGGCAAARAACARHGIRFVAGVELTCQWREREIHIVGLRLEHSDAGVARALRSVLEQRRERMQRDDAAADARRTARRAAGRRCAGAALPTRTHLARALCQLGSGRRRCSRRSIAGSSAAGRDTLRAQWPQLATAVQLHRRRRRHRRYWRIRTATRCPTACCANWSAEFKAAGGAGIEVSLAGMAPGDADRAAALARRFDLAGSIGSDFHEPELPWRPLGRFAKLPDRVTPITAHLALQP